MAREHTIGIRLDDEELAALNAQALTERRKRGDLARILVLDGLAARQKTQVRATPVAASSTRSERTARHDDGHAFTPGKTPLKCGTCGVPQSRHA